MPNTNAINGLFKTTLKDLLDAAGVTQFVSETEWFHTISGILIQGGLLSGVTTGTTVPYNASFPKQVLGVFVTPVEAAVIQSAVNTVTLDDFVVIHNKGAAANFYWFALGV